MNRQFNNKVRQKWAKDLRSESSKNNIYEQPQAHETWLDIHPSIKEMQIKLIVRYSFAPPRTDIIKKDRQ